MVNRFENKTPQAGVCVSFMPARCKALGIFSLRLPELSFVTQQPIEANHTDPRQGFMLTVPSDWRNVDVRHSSGDTEVVQIRIAGIGGGWNMSHPPGVSAWAGPGIPWQARWSSAPAPCVSTGFLLAGAAFAQFFWLVPEGAGACARTPSVTIPYFRWSGIDYVYELRTPNPLNMSAGEYRGTLSYSVGRGGDFDMGDALTPSIDTATLDFVLSVEHALKVDIPPGGNRIELVPQGGWQAWLNHGRVPSRLFRDQTFIIAASSRFKMQLECSIVSNNTCGLRNGNGDEVPLQVAVSLPYGVAGQDEQAVNRRPLRLDGVGTELFQPRYYVNDRPGTLHFEVARDDVAEMLNQPGSTYSGMVTVIWDSEV
ncbi:hypothetical protein HKK55_19585 [Pseudomonas sp. ADAK18]|nr:hypothetical protein HKK55_19585 [Pseudomonas sp. ADAK18]